MNIKLVKLFLVALLIAGLLPSAVGTSAQAGPNDQTTPLPGSTIVGGGNAKERTSLETLPSHTKVIPSSSPMETETVMAVTAGYVHTCALTENDEVKCWGNNREGQLGDGSGINRTTPVSVVGLGDGGITAISAGSWHTCALTEGGGVKCWGLNHRGQLGDGTTTSHSTPVNVVGLDGGAMAISAGYYHTCALMTSGGVKCWGSNQHGQLGNDHWTSYRTLPVDVVGLGTGTSAIDIDSGKNHTCVLTDIGGIKCWGRNDYGQLGDGTTIRRTAPVDVISLTDEVTRLIGAVHHTCVINVLGEAKCWGWNEGGQLGDGTTINRTSPVDVVGLGSALSLAIDGGFQHTCALFGGGNSGAKCWGRNLRGELGDGTTDDSATPVDVVGLGFDDNASIALGGYHSCAQVDGRIACWGDNRQGQLGSGTTIDQNIPRYVVGFGALRVWFPIIMN